MTRSAPSLRRLERGGFTLTELLIVIGIIAILLVLCQPVVSRAIEGSKTAGCLNNLRQLGAAMFIYEADKRTLIPGSDAAFGLPENITWISALRNYCDLTRLRSCPAAPLPGGATLMNADGNHWGGVKSAWQLSAGSWMRPVNDPGYASYGINLWLRKEFLSYYGADYGTTRVDNAQNIPMIMDARWEGIWPVSEDPVPPAGSLRHQNEIAITSSNWRMVDNLAMLRHGKGVNICFMDGSVRNVDVNDLWTLQWNRIYQPRGAQSLH